MVGMNGQAKERQLYRKMIEWKKILNVVSVREIFQEYWVACSKKIAHRLAFPVQHFMAGTEIVPLKQYFRNVGPKV